VIFQNSDFPSFDSAARQWQTSRHEQNTRWAGQPENHHRRRPQRASVMAWFTNGAPQISLTVGTGEHELQEIDLTYRQANPTFSTRSGNWRFLGFWAHKCKYFQGVILRNRL